MGVVHGLPYDHPNSDYIKLICGHVTADTIVKINEVSALLLTSDETKYTYFRDIKNDFGTKSFVSVPHGGTETDSCRAGIIRDVLPKQHITDCYRILTDVKNNPGTKAVLWCDNHVIYGIKYVNSYNIKFLPVVSGLLVWNNDVLLEQSITGYYISKKDL